METIGERITKARVYLGLNQKELCEISGITEASLSRYESGIREPKAQVLAKLSSALGVSTDYLLGITDIRSYSTSTSLDSNDKEVENILNDTKQLLSQEGLMFCGKPASKEAIDSILKAMKMGMLLALEEENKSK